MKITKQLLGEAKSGMILAMLASAVSAAAGIAIIAGINSALDGGITNPNSSLAIYAALLIALMISSICSQAMMVKIGYAMVYRMRKMLVNQLLNTPIERQEQIGAPLIYNVLNRDVNMVANATRELPVVVYNSLLVVAGFGYLYWLSPLLFGFVTVVAVLGVWSNAKLSNKLGVMLGKVRRLDDRLFGQYEAAVEGRNELALNPNRRHFLVDQQFDPTAQESRKESVKAEVLWAVNLNWTTVLIFTVIGVIFYAGLTVETITTQIVSSYILTVVFLRTPLSTVIESIPAIVRGNVALQAIERLGLSEDTRPQTSQSTPPVTFESLELKQASFQYPNQNNEPGFTLGPIDFSVKRGEVIFIVGGNGSGKSTLAKLLTGLYQPTSGEVQLNGEAMTTHNSDKLRHCFSAIFANFFLFTDVLDQQGETTNDEKITHYLKRLAIDNKVSVDQGRLSTTSLSQGQRKRLALLLLYMEDRQVLLLDEWAADQDPVFREVFYREILPEFKRAGKTVIAISHDDHYFDAADRIYKLDCGVMDAFDVGKNGLFAQEEKHGPRLAKAG